MMSALLTACSWDSRATVLLLLLLHCAIAGAIRMPADPRPSCPPIPVSKTKATAHRTVHLTDLYTVSRVASPTEIETCEYSWPQAINNAGVTVGYYGDFISSGFTAIPPYSPQHCSKALFPKYATSTEGVNNHNDTCGSIMDVFGNFQGYARVGGVFKTFQHPKSSPLVTSYRRRSSTTILTDINDNQLAVGFYHDAQGTTHGFVLDIQSGVYSELTSTYSVSLLPAGINNAGHIVGTATCTNGNTFGFLYKDGKYTYFSAFGSTYTSPTGINNNGDIVGRFGESPSGVFVASDIAGSPSFQSLQVPGASTGMVWLSGINDAGDIVGSFQKEDKSCSILGFIARRRVPSVLEMAHAANGNPKESKSVKL